MLMLHRKGHWACSYWKKQLSVELVTNGFKCTWRGDPSGKIDYFLVIFKLRLDGGF